MSPGDGEGRPRQGAPTPSSLHNLDTENFTPTLGQPTTRRAEVRNVYADGVQVRGTRGRDRLLLFVRCWMCGRMHQHGAKTDFVNGKRTAACGLGSYVVMLGAVSGEVAA